MEWALVGGQPFILQARPMVALPPETRWISPLPGAWLRNIRLGEWLPEPITPLFETWLLERMEEQFRLCQAADGGIDPPPPLHVCVNGWYFHSPIGTGNQGVLWRGLLRRPRLAVATLVASRLPSVSDQLFYREFARRWRSDVLATYQRLVADAQLRVEQADPAELLRIVDKAAAAAGGFFWSFTVCGGAAWRFERALAKFYDRHLKSAVLRPYQVLLGGLASPDTPGHFVYSIDWVRETLGELSAAADPKSLNARHEQASTERITAEASCRHYLAPHPRKAARFASLLAIAQHYSVIREEHSRWFTLAWPLLRRCAYLLGTKLAATGLLERPDDIFFIVRSELEDCLAGRPPEGLAVRALQRRAEWERQRMLAVPLRLGKAPFILSRLLLPSTGEPGSPAVEGGSELHGTPASPGYAVGPVRVLRGPAAMADVQPGDVLVVSAAVPALTPLFGRIAALCVDSGSVAAHASLMAREYGIPAITGLGEATTRLIDQSLVAVNGTTGVVELL
jgi:pyruvate,water dikinase